MATSLREYSQRQNMLKPFCIFLLDGEPIVGLLDLLRHSLQLSFQNLADSPLEDDHLWVVQR